MKKLILLMGLTLLLAAAGCGSNEANGKGPDEIPVEWATAMIQRDEATRAKLLNENEGVMSPDQGPQNNRKLGSYELTEWKANNEKYFYKIKFTDPEANEGRTETMEIIKTEDGWKRTKFDNLSNFENIVEKLDRKVLKEMQDE